MQRSRSGRRPSMPERIARSIRMTPELWAALEALAARQNRSVNNLLETLAMKAVGEPLSKR